MNTINLIGRMTKDPMIKLIDKGRDGELTQAVFTLAVDRGNDEADFIRCVAYGKVAEIIEDYTQKGVRVGVTGHIRTGSYEDEEGETRYTQDVIVDRFDFADGKRDPEEKQPAKKGGGRGRR